MISGDTVRDDFNAIRTVIHYAEAAHRIGLWKSERLLIERYLADWEAIVAQRGRNRYDRFNKEVLIDKLGDPRRKEELFREISPIHHLDNVKAPVFIYHGLWDDRVDSSQSAQLKRELERRNIPVEYFIMHDEGHSLSEYDNQVKVFTAIEDFLAAHLAAPAQP